MAELRLSDPFPDRLTRHLDAFEEQWKVWRQGGTGTRPDMSNRWTKARDALRSITAEERQRFWRNLLYVEVFHRRALGEPVREDDYRQRFPGRAPLIPSVFQAVDDVLGPAGRWSKGGEPVPGFRLINSKPFREGGSGQVWHAHAPGGIRVVLKRVALDRRMGAKELRALEAIKSLPGHARLLLVQAFWVQGSDLVIAMEPATRSLRDRLADCPGGLPPEELLKYMQETAEGLHYLHTPSGRRKKAILHGDIKPDNLLLVGGSVKIADFGLARILDRSTAAHSGGWTPEYAPPEWTHHRETKTQSDQYSLAATYVELRKGLLSLPPAVDLIPSAAEAAVVRRALDPRPSERWPSCIDFVKELTASFNGKASPSGRGVTKKERKANSPPASGPIQSYRGLTGHKNLVTRVVFTPDGRHILSASLDRTVRLWDAVTGAEVTRFDVGRPIRSLACTPDGTYFIAGSDDRSIRIWEIATRKETHIIPVPCVGVLDVAVSPDGRFALYGGPNQAGLIDLESRQNVSLLFDRVCITCLSFSRDGTRALFGSSSGGFTDSWEESQTVLLWDVGSRKKLRHIRSPRGHQINGLMFSPDGRTAVSASGSYSYDADHKRILDHTLHHWDLDTGTLLRAFGDYKHEVNDVAFSPDGARVLSGGADGVVRLWQAGTGAELCQFAGHEREVNSVAFSPDGAWAASGGGRVAYLWRLPDPHRRPFPASTTPAPSTFDGNPRAGGVPTGLSSGSTADGGRTLSGHPGDVTALVLFPRSSPSGGTLLSSGVDRTVRLWNLATGTDVHRLDTSDVVRAAAVFPDERRVLWQSGPATKQVWDVGTASPRTIPSDRDEPITSMAVSADGSCGLDGGQRGGLWLWDCATGTDRGRLLGHTGPVTCLGFSPDRRRALSGGRDAVYVWNLEAGKLLLRLPVPGAVLAVRYLSETRILVGLDDSTLHTMSLDPPGEVGKCSVPLAPVRALALSSDGRLVAAGGPTGVILVQRLPM